MSHLFQQFVTSGDKVNHRCVKQCEDGGYNGIEDDEFGVPTEGEGDEHGGINELRGDGGYVVAKPFET